MKSERRQGFISKYRFIFLISILSLIPLFFVFSTSQLFHSHDGLVHLPRIAAYFKALKDGEFPVRWAGDLNYGYGMPLFDFIYQTPYLVACIFLFIGFGLVMSFKLSLALSFVLSGIFMYLFAKTLFKDEKKGFLVAVFYQFASFHIIELLVRASFGELYTYTFLPLVLFSLLKLKEEKKYRYFLLSAFSTAFLIISHNAISLTYFGLILFFVIFFFQGKVRLGGILSLIMGLIISSYYWFPALYEHKYTYGDLFMKDLYKQHFPPFLYFLIPNFTNDKALQIGGISVQLGIFHLIGLLLAVYLFFFKKRIKGDTKKIILISFFLLFTVLFLMQPVSLILWEHISLLRQFQFPWRLLSVAVFSTAMFSVSFLYIPFFQKKWIYILLVLLVMVSTVGFWRSQLGYDTIKESYYWNFPLNTTYFGETDVIWSAGPAHNFPKQRVELISGKGSIKNFYKKTQLHTFTVDAATQVTLVDHTQYFPGWTALVDGNSVPIQFQDPNSRGQITFNVPQGTHTVKVIFGETKLRFITDLISLIFAVALFLAIPVVRKKYEF